MSRIVSYHRRVIAAVWAAAAVFFILTAAMLAMMRFDVADQRLDSRVSHFTAHVAAQPGTSAANAVDSFLALNIPDSDEVLAGIIAGEVIRMERAGRTFVAGDALHRAVTDQAEHGSAGSLPDLRFTSVTVHDAEGGEAMLVAAIDSSAQRQRDHTALALIGVLAVLLTTGVTAVARGPGGPTGTDKNTEATEDSAPPRHSEPLTAPSPTPGRGLRDIVVGPPDLAPSVRNQAWR